MGNFSDEVRQKVRELAEGESKRGLALAWYLGDIESRGLYLQWSDASGNPLSSFNAYWASDLKGHVSRSHAYALSGVGQQWATRKPLIERLVEERRTGIAELIEVTAAVKNGLDVDKALRYLEFGEPYMDGLDGGKVGNLIEVKLLVDKDKIDDFWRGLTYNAIRSQLETPQQSMIELALQEAQDHTLPQRFQKYLDMIEAGEFRCKLCSGIPTHPTDHHVFPVSLAQGWGPLVLLCEAPCHPRVQVRWLDYAIMWYGKKYVEEARHTIEQNLGMEVRWEDWKDAA